MSRAAVGFLSTSAVLLSGCAEMTHLTRTRAAGNSQFILIDAKQRAISSRGDINCAEPSPDALSAVAASQSLNLATGKGLDVGQSFAIAEAAGSIGLRTQSIQLLRDHMFRVCEAYQAGLISPFMVALFHRRFQTTMVGILAVEQLTGAVRPPTIVLGGSSSVGDADAIVKLTANRETMATSVEAAQKDLDEKANTAAKADENVVAKKKIFDDETDEAKKAAAKTVWETAKKDQAAAAEAKLKADSTLANRRAGLASIDRAMALAQSTGSASASGTIESIASRSIDVGALANAVQTIVTNTYELTNSNDFCTVLLADASQKATKVDWRSPVLIACLDILKSGHMLK